MTPNGESLNYTEIFKRQGVPKESRGPEDHFFHTVTKAESTDHAGEVYAIPRQLNVDGATYAVLENGALISDSAKVDPEATVDKWSIVQADVLLTGATRIGQKCLIGYGSQLSDTVTNHDVTVGPMALIDGAHIGRGSRLGKVRLDAGATIGRRVILKDGVQLRGDNEVGDDAILHKHAWVYETAKIGREVILDESAHVGKGARVGDRSRVMAEQDVQSFKRIRAGTLVVPRDYKRTRKSKDILS